MCAVRQLPILLLLVLAFPLVAAAAEPSALPPPVQAVLDGHRLGQSGLSVVVRPVDGGAPLLELNPDIPRSPASIIKLLTTFAALDMLGPAYTWRTEAWADGEPADGRLEGDLYLKGGGDPYLTTERFWTFLRGLRETGLGRVDGDLVIDSSYFRPEQTDPGAFDHQPYRTYNVVPDALLVNLKAVRFRVVQPGSGGKPVVMTDPVLSNLRIDNRLRSGGGACAGYQRGVAIALPGGPEGHQVVLSGRFPAACGDYSIWRTALSPAEFTYGVFQPLWSQLGGDLAGKARTGEVPEGARRLHAMESIPLAEVVRNVNKFSNNVMTRHLLLTLGAEREGAPGTETKGRAALDAWLADQGLSLPGLYVDNGAGLSRDTRISAGGLADLLVTAWRHPYMPEFVASMPLAGLDGTLRNRYRGESLAGRLHAKTGRLDDVYSLAGIIQGASGRRYVVVCIHNDHDVHRGPGQELQDALLSWAFAQ